MRHAIIGFAGSSVISESLIYVSYHNLDLAFAFELSRLLIRCYREAWLDRFEIAPNADWAAAMRDARGRATGVIAIVSDDYLRSAYCRSEFDDFIARDIPVTAVIARDFSTEAMNDFAFSDWVDCRRTFDDPSDLNAERLLRQFPHSEAARQPGERLDYLLQFIQDSVCALAKMPTAWAAMRMDGDIRPRLLPTNLLRDWHFTAIQDGEPEELPDLQAWAERQARFRLSGEAGSGKTCFGRLLALAQAHAALRDEGAGLPIWLDLALWDATEPRLDDFMEANWRLLSYWRHWTASHPGLFFLDNWSDLSDACPQLAEQFIGWINASPMQRFVLLANQDSGLGSAMPRLELQRPSATRAQKFAAEALTLEQQNSFRQILKQKRALIEDSPLAYLTIGIELLSADRALANTQWQRNPLAALLRLRGQHVPASRFGLRMEAVLIGLEELAWAMTQPDRRRIISQPEAQDTLRDRRIIEYALEIGILVETGAKLRFESEMMACCLVAEKLKSAGIMAHLSPPAFDAEAGRLPSQWDLPTMLLVDGMDEDERLEAASHIADVDAILAGYCLLRHPDSFESCCAMLLEKLVDRCAEEPAARRAFRNAIAAYPQAERIAELLIGQMRRLKNERQLWLWHEIAKLPLEPPPEFIERIANAETEATEFNEPYSLPRALAYLVALSQCEDANLRRKAILQMSKLKYLPVSLLLLDYLDRADSGDIDAILLSLINFAYSEILFRLLDWPQAEPGRNASLVAALAAGKRRVTSRLLALAEARGLTLQPAFSHIAATCSETDIALGLAQVAARFVDLPESVELAIISVANPERLHQQIGGAIKRQPNKAAFRQLVQDIALVLEDPPETTIIAGSKLDALLYGEAAFDDISAREIESSATNSREPHGTHARLQAIASMRGSRGEDALPLLLEATHDAEPRVRLAAYEMLAEHESQVAAQKAFLAGLADADKAVVAAVTHLLQEMALADYAIVYELLDSANPDTVAAAIGILGRSAQNDAITALSQLLNDERLPSQGGPAIGARAREAVASLQAAETQPHDQREDTGRQSEYSDEEKVRRTLQVLRDDDWGRTQKAAKFLRSFARHSRGAGSGAIRNLLCQTLGDENWTVRWAAAEALGILHDRDAIPALSQKLGDDNWIVQVAAVRALVVLRAAETAAQILPLLASRRSQLREAAAEALGEFHAPLAIAPLSRTLADDPDDFARLAAIKAICKIGAEDLRPSLELALSDSYLAIRLFAMRLLAPQMDESDLPILRKLLDEDRAPAYDNQSLRDLALETLERIGSQECRALLAAHFDLAERASA